MHNELDWAWAQRTSGNLTAAQKRKLALVIASEAPGVLLARAQYLFGRRGKAQTPLAAVPDTPLARAAQAEADSLAPWVRTHSYRTYFFARALASLDGVAIDEEHTYVAALLHDLNLGKPTPGSCFAYTGGERAVTLTQSWGATPEWANAIGAAACGHATPGADTDLSDPAGFVLAGSMADCIARRLGDFDPAWVSELLARYPKHELKRHLPPALRAEARAVPDGRIALVNRVALLPLLVRLAPYRE